MRNFAALVALALGLAVFTPLASAASPVLRVVFVDVEGGQATLFVTPTGQSLLIDTGWAGHQNRDADRIAAAAKQAGLHKIDYVLLTHYHPDHTGGVPQLVATFPVGTFIDHGPLAGDGNPGTRSIWQAYQNVLATGKYGHLTAKPGEVLPLTGVTATVVSSDGKLIDHNLAGGGAPNPFCAVADHWAPDTSENAYSVGVMIQYGKFKMLDLGDLTADKDRQMVCPNNRLGQVSLYVLANHGMTPSSSHALVDGIHPEVVVMDNGPYKGGSVGALDMVKSIPGLLALWQLHYTPISTTHNTVVADIVNDQKDFMAPDPALPLDVTAQSDGQFAVYNPRTKATAHYPAR
ncbi:MAG TPA: MBL fold metallo-hydrolase [Terriglobales bacterium]|nr:MBL fold metallo-hydrolase [Terriglobales bacterium]